jgi:hypothetical protein
MRWTVMIAPNSADLSDDNAVPYYFWDRRMSVGEIRRILGSPSHAEHVAVLSHLLREARPDEVWQWQFVSPADVAREWPQLSTRLGRRRRFWEWVLASWRALGLLS